MPGLKGQFVYSMCTLWITFGIEDSKFIDYCPVKVPGFPSAMLDVQMPLFVVSHLYQTCCTAYHPQTDGQMFPGMR